MSGPLDPIVRTVFRVLARVRGARVVHPRGLTFRGRVDVAGDGPLPTGDRPCTVRLSKSVGLPGRLPDVLGLALRVEGDGAPVDVLVSSCAGHDALRRFVLWPAASWRGVRMTTLLPYASRAGERVMVLLTVDEHGTGSADLGAVAAGLPLHLGVRVTGRRGDAQTGRLVLTGPVVDDVSFDPVLNPPAGWRLVPGWISSVRATAYVRSRAGRGAPPVVRATRARAGSPSR